MLRFIGRILILLFFIALLLTLLAPSVLSTHFGQHVAFRILRSMSGYHIKAKALHLSWTGKQQAEAVDILDKSGHLLFHTDTFVSSAPLWRVIFYHDVGTALLTSPSALVLPPAIASNIELKQASFLPSFTFIPKLSLLGDITVTNGSVSFIHPDLTLAGISIQASLLPRQVRLQASGDGGDGTFEVKLLAFPGTDQIDLTTVVDHFPLRAVDQVTALFYPHLRGMIEKGVGETLSGQVKIKNLSSALELYVNASSDIFSAHLDTRLKQDVLILATPALFRFHIPAHLIPEVTRDVMCELKLDELFVPLQHHALFTLHGTLKTGPIEVSTWQLEPLSLYIGGKLDEWSLKIDSPQIQLSGSLFPPKEGRPLSFAAEAFLPKNTTLDIRAPSLQAITISFQGDLGSGEMVTAFDPMKKTIALKEPSRLTLHLPQIPTPLQVTLEPAQVNLASQSGIVKGVVETAPFTFRTASFDEAAAHFTADLKTRRVEFSFHSAVGGGPLTLEGSYLPTQVQFKGRSEKLPTLFVQSFLPQKIALSPLLGDFLTTTFQAVIAGENASLQIKAKTPTLSLDAMLTKKREQFELVEPATFSWTLSPAGYQTLLTYFGAKNTLTLSEPAHFEGTLTRLTFPENPSFQGKIATDQLVLGSSTLQNFSVDVSPRGFAAAASVLPQGKLACTGTFSSPDTLEAHLVLDTFPTATFDFFLSPFYKKPFSTVALFGPTLNFELNTTLKDRTGPATCTLRSDNVRASLQGNLSQGTLTLTDTFHLQCILKGERLPIRTEGPITLEVAPQGFSLPLFPFNPSLISASKGRLELGKVVCKNEGDLQTTLGLLKLSQYSSQETLKLWFAPLDFQIQDGLFVGERCELLIAESLQVALWGKVNLPKDRIQGTLGLTANCLKKVFGIRGLPDSYVLQIPIQGSLENPKLDKGAATSRIGALLLWQQKGAAAGLAKGKAGALLGEVLNQIGPPPGGDEKAPPAKKPFPWQKEDKKSSAREGEKFINQSDSALRQAARLLR